MSVFLTPLLQLQRLFIPGLFVLLAWAVWRTVFRKDLAVGLVLYLGLVVIVDAYLNTGIYLPGLEKGSIRYSEVCAVFLLFNRVPASPQRPPRRTVYLLLSIYLALLFLSSLRSDSVLASIFEFRSVMVAQIVAFLVARRGLDSPQAYRRFFLCLTALIIILGLFTFWDLFFDRVFMQSDVLNKGMYFHNRELNRFGSFFLNPNYLGAFVVLVFPVAFVWTLNEQRPWPRLFAWTGLLALVFCLVETQSRGPILAFGVGLLLLVVGPCGGVSRTRRVGVLALFVMVFALFMPGFFQHAIGRFDKLGQETTTEQGRSRATTWIYTMRMIADYPLGGIGFGEPQFMRFMTAYGFGEAYGGDSLDAPHNSYLQAAVYAGIPALAAFLLANVVLLGRAAAALVSRQVGEERNTPTIFGLAVGIVGFLASIYPDIQLFTQSVAPAYWVFFGLLLSLITAVPQVSSAHSARRPTSWRSTEPRFADPRVRSTSRPGARPNSVAPTPSLIRQR